MTDDDTVHYCELEKKKRRLKLCKSHSDRWKQRRKNVDRLEQLNAGGGTSSTFLLSTQNSESWLTFFDRLKYLQGFWKVVRGQKKSIVQLHGDDFSVKKNVENGNRTRLGWLMRQFMWQFNQIFYHFLGKSRKLLFLPLQHCSAQRRDRQLFSKLERADAIEEFFGILKLCHDVE